MLTGEEGEEVVCELMEGHSVPEEMSGANEQIKLALSWFRDIVERVWMTVGEHEIGDPLVGQRSGPVEIGVYELYRAVSIFSGGWTKIDARSPVWARYSRFASADLMASSAEEAGRYLVVMRRQR